MLISRPHDGSATRVCNLSVDFPLRHFWSDSAAGLTQPAIVGASGCWVVAGAVARAGTGRRLGMCWRGRVGAGADERGSGRLVAGVVAGERCGVLMFWGGWYGAWGAIVAAERVGRRRRVGAKGFARVRSVIEYTLLKVIASPRGN